MTPEVVWQEDSRNGNRLYSNEFVPTGFALVPLEPVPVKIVRRVSYAEKIEFALGFPSVPRSFIDLLFGDRCLDTIKRQRFLVKQRKEGNEEFYRRPWTTEEVLAELRELAKDIETARLYLPEESTTRICISYSSSDSVARQQKEERRTRYEEAVRIGVIDSEGDLQRKADFLLRWLMRFDYLNFVITMSEEGMRSIITKLQLGAQIDQALGGVAGTALQSRAENFHKLNEEHRRACELFPESIEEIDELYRQERDRRLTEGK